ncbi:MAG: TolC family protein [Verrucomicrobia bacterium]|nr:TolC family protein [Verrucomicrobiota bacterium]
MRKIFNKSYQVAITACALSSLIAGNVNAETLTGAVEKVLRGHPRAKAAKAQADIAHYEAMEIRGSLLPRLNIGATVGPNYRDRDVSGLVNSGDWLNQSQGNLRVRQRVFQGGLAWNDTKAAKRRAESARLMAVGIDQQLALLVIESYLGILRGQEQVDLARKNVLVHEDTLAKTQARKDAGRSTQADIELVKARLGLARSSVETRKVLLENAKVRYRALVEEEPQDLESVGRLGASIPTRPGDADISANPSLLAAKENYEAAKFQKKAAKGLLLPLVELEVGGGLGNDVGGVRGQDDEAHAFLIASWDVWEGGARRAQKRQREKREEEALNLALSTQLTVEESLGGAIADRNGALLTEKQLSDYAKAIGEVVGAYEKQVAVGSRAMLNLLDVKNEDFRANSALVDAEFASLMAGYRVIESTGKLVEVVAPNVTNGNGNENGDGGGKNVVPAPAPDAQHMAPKEDAAPMMAEEQIEAVDETPAVKKKGIFSRMFGGRKSKSKYQAYDETSTLDTEEAASPAEPNKTAATSAANSKNEAYSWSAASPEKSKITKTTEAANTAVDPIVVKEEVPSNELVEAEEVAAEEIIDAAPEPKKTRRGFFKFLKPGKTVKSAKDSASEEVKTGEVDEVALNN